MWNKSITLFSEEEKIDEYGFSETQKIDEMRNIIAKFRSVSRNDILLSQQSNYVADAIIIIMKCNYKQQKYLIDEENNQKYKIERTYIFENSNTIQLTCSRIEK